MGFVNYGVANRHSSPVLTTRFFSTLQDIFKELKDDTAGLCLGETGTGGSTGMGALEGYAAALEVRLAVSIVSTVRSVLMPQATDV